MTIDALYETPGGTIFSNNTIDGADSSSCSYGGVVFGYSVNGGQNLVIVNNYFKNTIGSYYNAISNCNGDISNSLLQIINIIWWFNLQ